MSSVTRPRGPLPPRVYWTRRTLVVVVALALVFGVARLLGGTGSGGDGPSAQPVGADASTTPTTSTATTTDSPDPTAPSSVATAPTVDSSPIGSASPRHGGKKAAATPLPDASGPCASDDIVATPTIKKQANAGSAVVFAMNLTSKTAEACDFDVTSRSLVLKVTSGTDRIWSTQDCPGAVPKQSVVVRKDTPAVVDVPWSGQRSDTGCTRSTKWAEPGWYHALAAAYGSTPVNEQFRLVTPARPTVTATPKPHRHAKKSASASSSPTAKQSPKQNPKKKTAKGSRTQR